MFRFVVFVIVLLLGDVKSVSRVVPLLSGWHYDDILRDSIDPVASIIVMWSSTWCKEAFERFGLTPEAEDLPSRAHVFIGHYDEAAARKQVWWEEENFLDDRFNISLAPAVVYIPPGGNWENYQLWDGGVQHWKDWVRDRLALEVLVQNEATEALSFLWPRIDNVTEALLVPGASRKVFLQPGQRVVMTRKTKENNEEFFSAPLQALPSKSCAHGEVQQIIFDDQILSETIEQRHLRFQEENKYMKEQDQHLNARDQDTTFTHAAMIRQPRTVPGFDTTAYGLIELPQEVRDHMWKYYKEHEAYRMIEAYSSIATGINQHIVNTTLVSFDLDMSQRDYIAMHLIQPYVEQWAKRPLEFTSFYGIREYHRGHELRMHVDRVATHVFSVIVNLDQQGIDSDWTLDVINFDGTRNSVVMRPNTMLFYQYVLCLVFLFN